MTAFERFPKDGYSYSADDVGLALAGLVRRDLSGVPVTGMLGVGPLVSAVPASWKVQVGVFTYVDEADGAISFSGLSAAEQVDIVPAAGNVPSGQARIDLVCWDPVGEELVVEQGTPGVSPVVPPAGGFAPVATVRVNAGDGMVIAGQLAAVYLLTGLVGSSSGTYTPVVSGYSPGFAPAMRAEFIRSGDSVEVSLQAETDREISRIVGPILISTPFPIGATPVAVEGGGYFLIGPPDGKRIYELRVRQASGTQVVVELLRVDARSAERVPISQGGFASTDWMSWRARFSYTIS